jgi:hypothetical protein
LLKAYLVVTGTHEGVVAQITADIGGDDFTVDAIARDEVFVLSSSTGTGWGRVSGCSRHVDVWGGYGG